MGHSWKTLNRHLRRFPEDRIEFLEAKAEAIERPAMRVFRDIFENEDAKDSDRIAAADKAITHSRRELKEIQSDPVETLGKVTMASIERLAELANNRLGGAEAIDVEWTEIPDKEDET
jgi:hypothetical protein